MPENSIIASIIQAFHELYGKTVPLENISLQRTRRDVEGDLTLVVFPLTRYSGSKPEETAIAVGNYLTEHCPEIASFAVVKGFLNLVIKDEVWLKKLSAAVLATDFHTGRREAPRRIVVEYSSPNTNKPLHLGHIRNNLLGFSLARLLQANGHKVAKVNLVNDRGIHICKSM
ncbi:MAG: arginine--tRNA ligase, partial [Bacteroidales bacterium]|nr:arginine--tRNA ligase [Bacteroidales bacterium]